MTGLVLLQTLTARYKFQLLDTSTFSLHHLLTGRAEVIFACPCFSPCKQVQRSRVISLIHYVVTCPYL